jgi:predicted phage tail protein
MKVWIAQPLRSYTNEARFVEGKGSTLREVLDDLEHRYPGIRFRMIDEQDHIRQHIHIFIGQAMAHSIDEAVPQGQEVMIVAALSGG